MVNTYGSSSFFSLGLEAAVGLVSYLRLQTLQHSRKATHNRSSRRVCLHFSIPDNSEMDDRISRLGCALTHYREVAIAVRHDGSVTESAVSFLSSRRQGRMIHVRSCSLHLRVRHVIF